MQAITNYYHVVQQPAISQDIAKASQPSIDSLKVQKPTQVLVLRLTTLNVPFDVRTVFECKYPEHKWIISVEKESTPDQHYHIVLDPKNSFELKGWRKEILEEVFPLFKIPIASGNKGYSLSWNTGDNIFPYTLKDGKYWFRGYTNDEISKWKNQSYRKYVKDEFAIELEKIRLQYMTDSTMTSKQAAEKYIKLRCMFKQTLNVNNMKTMLRGWYYAKHPDRIDDLAEQLTFDL